MVIDREAFGRYRGTSDVTTQPFQNPDDTPAKGFEESGEIGMGGTAGAVTLREVWRNIRAI
jgi:hypothetical protein